MGPICSWRHWRCRSAAPDNTQYRVEAIVHLAAFAYVGESIEHPARYFENNVRKGLVLLETAIETGIRRFVFSSSCATYGVPSEALITEEYVTEPDQSLR